MTQQKMILKHLQDRGEITSAIAFQEYGVTRLSAVIFDLRKSGVDIITQRRRTRNRFGEKVCYGVYRLAN